MATDTGSIGRNEFNLPSRYLNFLSFPLNIFTDYGQVCTDKGVAFSLNEHTKYWISLAL